MGVCISIGYYVQQMCSSNKDYRDDSLTLREQQLLHDVKIENLDIVKYTFTTCKVLDVYDGDTFWVAAYHNGEIIKFNIRLYGVDCPEMNGPCQVAAGIAKNYVVDRILNKVVEINVLTNTRVFDKSKKGRMIPGTYDRLIANIIIDGSSLTEELISKGYGVPYFGGSRK